jgi:hypothetical protein
VVGEVLRKKVFDGAAWSAWSSLARCAEAARNILRQRGADLTHERLPLKAIKGKCTDCAAAMA